MSESDEELSSDDGMDYEAQPHTGARGAKPGPPSDESDDEPVVFTEADLIEGEEDAQRLAAMTELEREFELAERSERKQQELQRSRLLRRGYGRGSRRLSDASDDDDAGERPGSWKTRFGGPAEREAGDDEEASFEEACAIVLPRHRLESWHTEPFFSKTLPGCLVRVSLGARLCADGIERPRYVLAQVVDSERRAPGVYKDAGQPWKSPYPFGAERTDTWLRVCRGYSERGMPMALVSNGAPSEEEWEAWRRACREEGRAPLSRAEVADARARVEAARGYTYSAADRLRDAAAEAGDVGKTRELEAQLAALEEAARAALLRRGAGPGMERINRKNRGINFQNAINNVSNQVLEDGAKAAASGSVLDPFSRRVTRPQNYWSTKDTSGGGGGNVETAEAVEEAAPAEAAAERQPDAPADNQPAKPTLDLSALDLTLLDRPAELPFLARRLLGDAVARQIRAANRRAVSGTGA
ncbi:hypothetical protein QBZ16_001500 [Prototheca wickerhamii]|uniref:Plus3 domain-containing protein n=1 Tax=Prototheca wickerhamii TaxID=3111 RepID=A0AAD9IET1_PROWI|nr:hypothetical protein QBZ16_001500 [Prototheca wickerhamii]